MRNETEDETRTSSLMKQEGTQKAESYLNQKQHLYFTFMNIVLCINLNYTQLFQNSKWGIHLK